MNPEIYVYHHGVRLEEVSEELVQAIHDIMRASLSPAGYAKARGCYESEPIPRRSRGWQESAKRKILQLHYVRYPFSE